MGKLLKKLSTNILKIKSRISNLLKKTDRFPFFFKTKIKNLEVKFNILFFIPFLLPLYIYSSWEGLMISSFLILTIILHEAAHAVVAIKNKINVMKVFFTYWGGAIVVDFKDLIKNNSKAIKIIFAGPLASILSSLVVCAICLFVGLDVQIAYTLFVISAFIGLSNLIPIVPLDGGLLLYFMLRKKFSPKMAKRISIYSSITCCSIIIAYILFFFKQSGILFSSALFFILMCSVFLILISLLVLVTRKFFKEVEMTIKEKNE